MTVRPPHLLHLIVVAPQTEKVHRWSESLPVKPGMLAFPEQLHTSSVTHAERSGMARGVDGLWTQVPLPLAVRTADCVPLFAWNPASGTRALVHAGRAGLGRGIVEETFRALLRADPEQDGPHVWLGPHIGPCCYRFKQTHPLTPTLRKQLWAGCIQLGDEVAVDLSKEIRRRFLHLGVKEDRFGADPRCTGCHGTGLPSHRRDGEGRQTALLTICGKPGTTGDILMGIDPELLKILACPETKEPVSLASAELIEKLNELIENGAVKNRAGEDVRETMDAGLIRDDGRFLYPIRDDIPVMLIDEAIEIPALGLE